MVATLCGSNNLEITFLIAIINNYIYMQDSYIYDQI